MSGAECFLDTNILVYLFDRGDQRRRGIAQRLVHRALREQDAVISWQVAEETLAVINAS